MWDVNFASLGFRVWGLDFRMWCLGSRRSANGFLHFRVWDSGFEVAGFGFGVWDSGRGCWVLNTVVFCHPEGPCPQYLSA